MFKPNLVSDCVEDKVKYPCGMQPKIDGVRGLGDYCRLVGRSLKPVVNVYTQKLFSDPGAAGLDGEFAAEHECHPDLCRLTTSALSTIEGEPFCLWWVFDYVTDETKNLPYSQRYEILVQRVAWLQAQPELQAWAGRLRVVPMTIVHNREEMEALDAKWLEMGYEGSIVVGLDNPYKEGRSTVREGGRLRIKRFVHEDAIVLSIEEGEHNGNPAEINELGRTSRSSHKENKFPNGMVGALICTDKLTNATIRVGAGRMTHADRLRYFEQPDLIVGQTIKYKRFPKGEKDKPRFPTFQTIRTEFDI